MAQNSKKDRFVDAYKYLYENGKVHSVTELADKIGRSRPSVSRAMNGVEEYLNDKFLKSFTKCFPGVFNLDYLLTGEGELLANGQQMNDGVAAASPSDYREKYIESLEKQIKDKDQQIADLRRDIQMLYKRLNLDINFDNMRANIFGGIAADELQKPAHDND